MVFCLAPSDVYAYGMHSQFKTMHDRGMLSLLGQQHRSNGVTKKQGMFKGRGTCKKVFLILVSNGQLNSEITKHAFFKFIIP